MARSTSKRRVRNAVTFKWTKELIIFLAVMVALICLAIGLLIPTSSERLLSDFQSAASDSDTALEEDNVFEYISYKKLVKKLNNSGDEKIYVLYGSSKDSTTVSNIQTVNKLAQDFNVDKVYIFKADFAINVDKDDDDEVKRVEDREEKLGVKDLYTYCQLWVIRNGKIEFNTQEDVLEDEYVGSDTNFVGALHYAFGGYDQFL